MQINLKYTILLSLFAISFLRLSAQEFSYKTNLKSVALGAISTNNKIIGYAAFYRAKSLNELSYYLDLYDENLQGKHSIKLDLPEETILESVTFNGQKFCCSFSNYKQALRQFSVIDTSGKVVTNLNTTVRDAYYQQQYEIRNALGGNSEINKINQVISIKNKGFILLNDFKNSVPYITMLTNDGKISWKKDLSVYSDTNSAAYTRLFALGDTIIYFAPKKTPGISNLLFIDATTGSVFQKIEIKNALEYPEPYSACIRGKYIFLIGISSNKIKKRNFDKSTIFKFRFNFDNKIDFQENYIKVSSLIGQDCFEQEKDLLKADLTVRQLTLSENGSIVALLSAQLYRPSFKITPCGCGYSTFETQKNFIWKKSTLISNPANFSGLFSFIADSTFTNLKLNPICMEESKKSSISLANPGGSELIGPFHLGAFSINSSRYFSPNTKNDRFGFALIRSQKNQTSQIIYAELNQNGELLTDIIPLNRDIAEHVILPSRRGYITSVEYTFSNQTTITRLIKTNSK